MGWGGGRERGGRERETERAHSNVRCRRPPPHPTPPLSAGRRYFESLRQREKANNVEEEKGGKKRKKEKREREGWGVGWGWGAGAEK